MKLRSVSVDARRRRFDVRLGRKRLSFPFVRARPAPSADDPVKEVFVDDELGREAFTYVLSSGAEGTVHGDEVLDFNADPAYLRELLLHRLSIEAEERLARSGLSKREVIRLLKTSPAQLYRLLDPTNTRKSIDQMIRLLAVLSCEVELVIRERSPSPA